MVLEPLSQPYPAGTVFKHYKNKLYAFLYLARHSESLEEVVVYQALYGDKGIWVRPKDMFFGTLELEGRLVARFAVHDGTGLP